MIFSAPGWYQLLGDPASGKTTLATVSTWKRESVFFTTPTEYSPGVWEVIGVPLNVVEVELISIAFEAMYTIQDHVEFIVLDSLGTLQPSHPGANQLARDIERYWFKPKIPILVVNQLRYPQPVGGRKWHASCQTYTLRKHRDRPWLYSQLEPTDLWLVWDEGGPVLRGLIELDEMWLGGVR